MTTVGAPHVDVHPALELREIAVGFGDRPGLAHINLALARGERLALLGPSGAGKTSLLRAIAGFDALRSGQLFVNGADVSTAPPEQRRTVYLHQTPALFPHLSVIDNVAFPFRLRGVPRAEARRRAGAWLDRMQLSALADRATAQLSGGERHRTALARALAAEPAVLLLDEPFAALDPALRAEVRAQVLEVLAVPHGPAAIIVTHDVDEAALMGERMAVVLDGQIAQCAPTNDVLQRPASIAVARLLGVPNVIPGTRDGSGRWHSVIGTFPLPGAPGTVAAVGWADMIRVDDAVAGASLCDGAPAIVVAVEHRGLSRIVRVRLGESELVGHIDRESGWQPGDRVSVSLRAAAAHWIGTTSVHGV